jgi:glycosyltransferase involved in cell wall biosynthesis
MTAGKFEWKGWHLIVVGDGDPAYVSYLKSIANSASFRLPKVEWIGPVWGAARWPYIQGADLFCLPTHSENFGLAVLEALHAGTPVLTTDQTPWVECSGRDGIFISKPNISSLQQTLSIAIERIELDWSSNARRELSIWADETFSWNKLAHAYADAYQRIA